MWKLFFLFFSFFVCAKPDTIYIYNDEGVEQDGIKHLRNFSSNYLNKYKIVEINAKELLEGQWIENALLFIMPGGADRFYQNKLQGKGDDLIKHYVAGGGRYLGICAGAYYASSYVEFDQGGGCEVIGSRGLKFFPGKSVGPAFRPFSYSDQSGSKAIKVSAKPLSVKNVSVYYDGGGYFDNAFALHNVEILGQYVDGRVAIVGINYGKGKVVLSAVHFEYNFKLFDETDQYLKKIIPALKKDEPKRNDLIRNILNWFDIA